MRPLVYSTAFIRAAKQITRKNPQAAAAIRETLEILEADAFDPRLRTHKLKGILSGSWSSSAGYDLRIVFDFETIESVESIRLLSVGTHDQVY